MMNSGNEIIRKLPASTTEQKLESIFTMASSLNRKLIYIGGMSTQKKSNVKILVLDLEQMQIKSKNFLQTKKNIENK